jgi:hypothetical protein
VAAKTVNRLSHEEFFTVAVALKKYAKTFMEERPSHPRAAAILADVTRLNVTASCIPRLQQVTGVVWVSRKQIARRGKREDATGATKVYMASTRTALKALVRAVHLVYVQKGIPTTEEFENLYRHYRRIG